MPINYARGLTGRHRTARSNRHLGYALAFVAGGINAGGFLAVKQYTSHMTGIVSAMADHIALGEFALVLVGAGALLTFMLGAACTAVMVNFARRRQLQSEYALPLLAEASLLLCFGILGGWLAQLEGLLFSLTVPATVMLLCFIMGLQNALITKLSHADIRTTHITGVVTDIGIELGKLFYWNRASSIARPSVLADRQRLGMLITLVCSFFAGGVAGAFGFKHLGYVSTVPLALILITLAVVPAVDDIKTVVTRWAKAQAVK